MSTKKYTNLNKMDQGLKGFVIMISTASSKILCSQHIYTYSHISSICSQFLI